MNERVEFAITNRTEACFRAIVLALHEQRRIGEDGRYADRAQIINTLRQIKAKAIEAEQLLHSLNRSRGDSSTRAPAASPAGDRGIESAPRSTTSREVKR